MILLAFFPAQTKMNLTAYNFRILCLLLLAMASGGRTEEAGRGQLEVSSKPGNNNDIILTEFVRPKIWVRIFMRIMTTDGKGGHRPD
jgi:hypothetical protein